MTNPTPAKEPSGELEKAVEELAATFYMLTANIKTNLEAGAIECRQDEDCDHCALMQDVEQSEAALAAYHAQVTKEGV